MLNCPRNAGFGPQCGHQMVKLKKWKQKASFVDSAISLKVDLLIKYLANLQHLHLYITANTMDLKQNLTLASRIKKAGRNIIPCLKPTAQPFSHTLKMKIKSGKIKKLMW